MPRPGKLPAAPPYLFVEARIGEPSAPAARRPAAMTEEANMRLSQSLSRKLALPAVIAAAALTLGFAKPAAAQYYGDACAPGYYFAAGYGCLPAAPAYAYPPGYAYAPYVYAPFGFVGGFRPGFDHFRGFGGHFDGGHFGGGHFGGGHFGHGR